MLVHRCDRCCVYKKEIQPCRTKYRGIWAILMDKMMFPQFCFKRYILRIPSVFCYRGHFLPAYPLNHFAYPWGYAYPSLGTDDVDDVIQRLFQEVSFDKSFGPLDPQVK